MLQGEGEGVFPLAQVTIAIGIFNASVHTHSGEGLRKSIPKETIAN